MSDASDAFVWSAERLRSATDAADIALWSWNVDTDEVALDERGYMLWGVERRSGLTFSDLSKQIHPADIDRVQRAFNSVRDALGAFELDFRIVRRGETQWIIARGQGGEDGLIERVMFGVFLDATQRKEAEELRDDLAGEMSHRVKNVFALASSMVAIAARSASTPVAMAEDLNRRLRALAVAHDLVRPTPGERGHEAALLKDLFAAVLAPYDDNGCIGGRIHVDLPNISVGDRSATTLALVIHELATNSVKYGALSKPEGSLRIACTPAATKVAIHWTETGGPPLSVPIGPLGFGSKLIARSMSGQLHGGVEYVWQAQGAVITLQASTERLRL
ncbi:sensor histidine kinase [Sphingomonas bacterium]|uniref:sensor histidine kinase n=1 Tax=Sphingomonas bacterium TaxID=1895847 RepID=UPI0015761FD3|nr:sensor histidine kinase [Sphingomonas bacterium]